MTSYFFDLTDNSQVCRGCYEHSYLLDRRPHDYVIFHYVHIGFDDHYYYCSRCGNRLPTNKFLTACPACVNTIDQSELHVIYSGITLHHEDIPTILPINEIHPTIIHMYPPQITRW